MPISAFKQVDVFTQVPFLGNPVAVILDAEGLSTDQMQRIARWTNLSETTFVLPPTQPDVDYRVRIFTPGSELPFAGHPTLGTAHALLEAGRIAPREGRLVQECAAGLIRLSVDGVGGDSAPVLSFELPAPTFTLLTLAQMDVLDAVLGAPVRRDPAPQVVDVGPRWLVAELADAAAVLALRPDGATMKTLDAELTSVGVTVYGAYPVESGGRIEVRSFAPSHGIAEDPVCGSGNGCVAAFIRHTGQISRLGREIVSTQGGAIGRAGVLRLSLGDDGIRVGGASVTCVNGTLVL